MSVMNAVPRAVGRLPRTAERVPRRIQAGE